MKNPKNFILLFGTLIISLPAAFPASANQLIALSQILRHNSSLMLNKLGNFTGFQFQLENKDVCGNESVFMLIFVGSAPKNIDFRNMYRRALLNLTKEFPELKFKMLFNFGALQDRTQQNLLQEEIEQYHDIIQGNFLDSYRNVTLRDLMSFRWAWQHCPQTKYVVHLDDDTVFNAPDLIHSLESCCRQLPVFIGCYKINKENVNWVLRDGHYGVSIEELPDTMYPDYCAGKMYAISPLMAYLLDQTALTARQYWMNDAYITGSLVKQLNITRTDLRLKNTSLINDHLNMQSVNKSRSVFEYFKKK